MVRVCLLVLFLVAAAGCAQSFVAGDGRDAGVSGDLGLRDAGLGTPDLALPDLGAPDLGLPDSGGIDFGTPDECTHGWRLGEPCARDFDCDDRCVCNGAERCIANRCAPATVAACPPSVPCATATCDDVLGCGWRLDPSACDDHEFCNGVEICVPEYGCRPGVTPLCDDGNDCTYDSCPIGLGCQHTGRDDDGDGHVTARCGGDDCNDDLGMGASIYPGADDGCNGVDDDCSGDWDYDRPECHTPFDTCATATIISGPDEVEGTTVGNADDYVLSCGPGGQDVVFHLHVATAGIVQLINFAVGTHVTSPTMAEAIAIRPWGSCAAGPDLRCVAGPYEDDMGIWHPTARMPIFLSPGEYAVIVEHATPCSFVLQVL